MAPRTPLGDDPLEIAMRPPANETAAERAERIAAEQEAIRISAEIDEMLKAERLAAKKRRTHEVKVLLLGQEASGKTTTLKQFLLNFSSEVFAKERASWRIIVFLNVITSFRIILEALSQEFESTQDSPISPESQLSIMLDGHPSSFAEIKLRLLPVLHEEANLVKKLVGNDVAFTVKSYDEATPKEPAVRSGTAWKRAFEKANGRPSSPATVEGIDFDDRADPGVILHACREEMMALWQNERVHEILKRRRVNLEDSGFFLDQLDRITSRRFIPTDDDILRTRLKTVGAAEHNFTINTGPEKGIDWKIYDVGGSRTQRQTWAPFFDDVNAILFLAPISAFDQVLTEDRRVNRLEDSLTLWTELCRNKILANVPLILFLNKCDLLQLKLESGVIVKKYVTSYADRPNDFPNVSHYFRAKFEAVKRHHSPPEREVFIHLTSMTDSKAMYAVIGSVRDMITRIHLKSTSMI